MPCPSSDASAGVRAPHPPPDALGRWRVLTTRTARRAVPAGVDRGAASGKVMTSDAQAARSVAVAVVECSFISFGARR
jgi:hypothetical protein